MKLKWNGTRGFLIGLFLVLVAYTLFNRLFDGVILRVLGAAWRGSGPILSGFVIAFLLNPMVRGLEQSIFHNAFPKLKYGQKLKRILSITIIYLFVLAVIGGIVAFLIPSLYSNLKDLITRLPAYVTIFFGWLSDRLSAIPLLKDANLPNTFAEWSSSVLQAASGKTQYYLQVAGSVIVGVGKFLFDSFIAMLVAFFILKDKEKYAFWSKRLWKSLVTNDYLYSESLVFLRDAGRTFSSYIVGRLIQSLIFAVVSMIAFLLLDVQYGILFAIIIGLFNLIPYFGPVVGAVPVILLSLLDNPTQAAYVTIFLVAFHQVDSFLIGPLLIGERLKVSAFWVLVGVLLGGAMFGLIGMVIGAPLMAIMANLMLRFIQWRHAQKISDVLHKNSEGS